MELVENDDSEANVTQNDNTEQEIEDGPSTGSITRLIPGYETFDDFLQVCLLLHVAVMRLPENYHLHEYLANKKTKNTFSINEMIIIMTICKMFIFFIDFFKT